MCFLLCYFSGGFMSKASIAFPVRRVSSLTDLLKFKEGRKSSLKICRSEGNIPSTEFVITFDVLQDSTGQQLHICENDEELQSTIDETVRNNEL